MYNSSLFSTSSLTFVTFKCFHNHFDRYDVVSHCGFCIALMMRDVILRSLIHVEFVLVYRVRKSSNIIVLYLDVQFSWHHFFFFWLYHGVCGILAPQWGTEPRLKATKVPSLNHWTTRELPSITYRRDCLSSKIYTISCLVVG